MLTLDSQLNGFQYNLISRRFVLRYDNTHKHTIGLYYTLCLEVCSLPLYVAWKQFVNLSFLQPIVSTLKGFLNLAEINCQNNCTFPKLINNHSPVLLVRQIILCLKISQGVWNAIEWTIRVPVFSSEVSIKVASTWLLLSLVLPRNFGSSFVIKLICRGSLKLIYRGESSR